MEQFDPVVNYSMKINRGELEMGINVNAHEISDSWIGEVHNHSRFELHIIHRGACQVDVEGISYKVQAGQAAVVVPGQYHRVVPTAKDFRRLTLGISSPQQHIRDAIREAIRDCVYDLTPAMAELCRCILAESEEKPAFYMERMRAQMAELAILFLRLINLQDMTGVCEDRQFRPQDVIDNYFEFHMGQNPSADDLADRLHISRRHLNRILMSVYGMGFREKLLRARMDQAKWLLRHTDKSVSVIAGEVGYTYDSAFRQAFLRQFGITPKDYRLRHKRSTKTERNEVP